MAEGGEKETFIKGAIELAAKKLHSDYMEQRSYAQYSIEPERYFDVWALENLHRVDEGFKEGVFRVFIRAVVFKK